MTSPKLETSSEMQRLVCEHCRRLRWFRRGLFGTFLCLSCDWRHPEAHR